MHLSTSGVQILFSITNVRLSNFHAHEIFIYSIPHFLHRMPIKPLFLKSVDLSNINCVFNLYVYELHG